MPSIYNTAYVTVKKFIYINKKIVFRPLLISFIDQNRRTDCIIKMARVRFAHYSRLGDDGATRTVMFVRIVHTIMQRKKTKRKNRENRVKVH